MRVTKLIQLKFALVLVEKNEQIKKVKAAKSEFLHILMWQCLTKTAIKRGRRSTISYQFLNNKK